MKIILLAVAAVFTFAPAQGRAQALLPAAKANDNRSFAGTLQNGALTVHLSVVRAMFHPDRDDDPGVDILALQEDGHAPSIPAPLIRVPRGTEVRTTIRNTLTDSSVLVYGLSGSRTLEDTVRIQPGETRELVAQTTSAGNAIYQVTWSHRPSRFGGDRLMTGAFIVDEPGAGRQDRVLIILEWMDSTRLKRFPGAVPAVFTINGKVWPFTERMQYDLGETITWRVINGSFGTHPMHLHGIHFDVAARGTASADTIYDRDAIRRVFTERMTPTSTMTMRWKPERAGNWLFHCHLNFHIMPHPPLGEMKASSDGHSSHGLHGMGGLVLGTEIRGKVARDVEGRRRMRLQVDQFDSIPGDRGPPFAYSLTPVPGSTTTSGPPIIVAQDEPLAITVVNRAKDPTSVHWHGLEIESYYDGVGGYGGTRERVTPNVAPGDSFVVKITPPRAGTYIYHSHFDEVRQQSGGLSGPFIVTAPGQPWDADHERIIMFSSPHDTVRIPVLINGSRTTAVEMKTGETYRLRFINITLANSGLFASVTKDGKPLTWKIVAKDAIDVPAGRITEAPSNQPISIGETFDMLFTPPAPGDYAIEARAPTGVILGSAKLIVR